MKIDGQVIAEEVKTKLKKTIAVLIKKNIIPRLAIILVGNDKSSQIYVKQKIKLGKELQINILNIKFKRANLKKLTTIVNKLNNDKRTHGIIIQRPLPFFINSKELNKLVAAEKDVDGFHPESYFDPPVALAVIKIIQFIYQHISQQKISFAKWLWQKRIVVIGRGETAGQPIAKYLQNKCAKLIIAHSQSKNIKNLCLAADIIVSCVGKSNIVRHDMVKSASILIGVGLHPEDDKLTADYKVEEIAEDAIYYTPVPGGVGPVNVAMLFSNLIKAALTEVS